jgi:hypothetical protein
LSKNCIDNFSHTHTASDELPVIKQEPLKTENITTKKIIRKIVVKAKSGD